MAPKHIITGAAPTPCDPDWETVAADLGELLATMTGRKDLALSLAPGAGHGAPACYLPDHHTVELDTDVAFGDLTPDQIDAADSYDHFWYPTGIGLLAHQAAHIRHTQWESEENWPGMVARAAAMLEDLRIEQAHLSDRPADWQWLRSAASELVLARLDASGTGTYPQLGVARAAEAACLCLGRVDAGVFEADSTGIPEARDALTELLGDELLAKFERLWREAMRTGDTDRDRVKAVAAQWCKLLVSNEARQSAAHTGWQSLLHQALAVATELIEAIAASAPQPTSDPGQADEGWPVGGGGSSAPGGQSHLTSGQRLFAAFTAPAITREPTDDEQTAAAQLATAFATAQKRTPTTTKSTSAKPPGRLHMRGARAASAQRAMGQPVTAQPWQQHIKTMAPDPTARVGIALDVSGSMDDWLAPAGACAWLLAQATAASGGNAAAATFGEQPRALLAPGTAPTQVPIPIIEAATDHADTAIAALIETLELGTADGDARMLVLITDGGLTTDQFEPVKAQCAALRQAGSAVLQLAPAEWSTALEHTDCAKLTDPVAAIDIITTAVTEALRTAANTTP